MKFNATVLISGGFGASIYANSLEEAFNILHKKVKEEYGNCYNHISIELNNIDNVDNIESITTAPKDEFISFIDKFIEENIIINKLTGANKYIPSAKLFEKYLKYYEFTPSDIGKSALSRNKFIRYIRQNYKEIETKQKKINGVPVMCFFNVMLKGENNV